MFRIPRPRSARGWLRLAAASTLSFLAVLSAPASATATAPAATAATSAGARAGATQPLPDPGQGYYQHPTLAGSTLVFASEGDLWTVPATGGQARRLTSHPTEASHPHLSPDGRWVAFTGRYDGRPEVYLLSMDGGPPRRLTWESDEVLVQGWTPDGRVLYASGGSIGPSWFRTLRTVHPETLDVQELPLADAREGAFDEEGTLFFTRFGLEVTGDNAREYQGGAAAQLWRFHATHDAEAMRLAPDLVGSLSRPMFWDGMLYVVSDQDGGVANLWRMAPDGSGLTRLTHHTDWEVRGATLNAGRIVYQHGADLRRFDIVSGSDMLLPILLGSDRARTRERWIENPLPYLESATFAPDGTRVVVTIRGQLAVIGTGDLRRIEIPLPASARAREAVLSPDGRTLFAIVDQGSEQEIWRFPADGRGEGTPLTRDGAGHHRTGLHLSPDGRFLAHGSRRGQLWLLEVERGDNRALDHARGVPHRDVVWSPDGSALAVVRIDSLARRSQIVLLDRESGTPYTLTSDRYESYSPAFSLDGRWLYFLSDRTFVATPGGPWGDRNLGPLFDARTRIYALALQEGGTFPLMPATELSGTQASATGETSPTSPSGPANSAIPAIPAIQFQGLSERLFEVPVRSGNFSGLLATRNRLYLLERPMGGGSILRTVDFGPDAPRLDTYGEGITQATLSRDGNQLMIRRATGGEVLIVPAGAQLPPDLREARVRLEGWRLAVDPREEWTQMFHDAWRMQREFLFDPALRGQDWDAIRDRYAPLVERIGDRRELDDILRQMVGELGVLHSQVRGGEYPDDPERPVPSYLGATFRPVEAGLAIQHIYRTDPELPQDRAPLTRPGVAMATGDILVAINGRPVRTLADLDRALAHQAGEQVRLDYLRGSEARSAIAHPVGAARESALRYSDWVTGRREQVEAASDGRLGYLHLRAMGAGDMADFAREFYANVEREGLIIDVRRNRGGNIDSWVIEKLLRRAWSFWQPPEQDPYWNMQQTFRGHLVVLADPLTYSDGETFAAGVKALGLGPVIGERTAGAGVWLSDTNRLVDQGIMRAAQTPQFGADGAWIIEGFGVIPDHVVTNLPHATWRGEDAQLARGIAELLRKLEAEPVVQPPAAPIPPRAVPGQDVPPFRAPPG
jgi:tricorn protease